MFITCGGTFTAGSSARLGASWSGAGKAGAPAKNSKGGDGGAGYGGAGGSDTDSGYLGGNGGVGGGGGGSDGAPGSGTTYGYDAGKPSGTTGGSFLVHNDSNSGTTRIGGTQGRTSGGSGVRGGGGGAGGNGSNIDSKITASGASLILIAKTLKADTAAISTGGAGGLQENNGCQYGGGGTGFCYIACERMS